MMNRLIPSRQLLVYGFVPCAVGVVLVILALISPLRREGPLGQLWIGRDRQTAIKLPGDRIACPDQSYQQRSGAVPMINLRCETLIEGQSLALHVSHPSTNWLIEQCTATYAGQTIRCESRLEMIRYARPLPIVSLGSDLGIPPARQQMLRWQYPLEYLSEGHWWPLLLIYGSLITALEIYFVGYSRSALQKAVGWYSGQTVVRWGSAVIGGIALWVVIHLTFFYSLFLLNFID